MAAPESNHSDLSATFEILLEQIDGEISLVTQQGASAFTSSDDVKAQQALDHLKQLRSFRHKVAALESEWRTLSRRLPNRDRRAQPVSLPPPRQQTNSPRWSRSGPVLHQPRQAYYRPILTALSELGGSAPTGLILDRVQQLMHDLLTEADYEPLPSSPGRPRWRSVATGAHGPMRSEGLLDGYSPQGTWTITNAGCLWLTSTQTTERIHGRACSVMAVQGPAVRTRRRTSFGRLPTGHRTPVHDYYRPILEVLVALGGIGRLNDILRRIQKSMRLSFKPADLTSSPSRPYEPSWRTCAQWARVKMVKQGLLKADSPAGTWEITLEGRSFLVNGS